MHVGFFSGTQKLMVKILGFFSPFPEWYCVWFHVLFDLFVGRVETSQVAVVIKKMHFEYITSLWKEEWVSNRCQKVHFGELQHLVLHPNHEAIPHERTPCSLPLSFWWSDKWPNFRWECGRSRPFKKMLVSIGVFHPHIRAKISWGYQVGIFVEWETGTGIIWKRSCGMRILFIDSDSAWTV